MKHICSKLKRLFADWQASRASMPDVEVHVV